MLPVLRLRLLSAGGGDAHTDEKSRCGKESRIHAAIYRIDGVRNRSQLAQAPALPERDGRVPPGPGWSYCPLRRLCGR
jgi:hypothetical protein